MKKFILFLATGFGVGYSPIMPGTMGTIVAVLLFLFASMNVYIFYSTLLLLLIISVPLSGAAEKIIGQKDPASVVIDEIVGYFVAMVGLQITWGQPFWNYKYLILGFVIFRIFDIVKPWPIKQLQDLKGGWGIVIDDVVAGIFTRILLQIAYIFLK